MFSINKPSFQLLERSLDASSMRQKVIANNIANVDTPYFKRSQVNFESLLQSELNAPKSIEGFRTDPRHFFIGNSFKQVMPQVVKDENSVMNNNMNNVDIDSEMSLMAKNQLTYNTEIQQVNHDIRQLRTAIDRGK